IPFSLPRQSRQKVPPRSRNSPHPVLRADRLVHPHHLPFVLQVLNLPPHLLRSQRNEAVNARQVCQRRRAQPVPCVVRLQRSEERQPERFSFFTSHLLPSAS